MQVTVSPKYEVVIPEKIRESMGIKPGQMMQAIQHGNVLALVPVRPISELRGFLSGIDTHIEREPDRL